MIEKTFVNVSNHPVKFWDPEQLEAAKRWGPVKEIPFPLVDPDWNEEQLIELAKDYILKIQKENPAVVMVQGEYGFTYALIQLLKERNIKVVYACTQRDVSEQKNEKGENIKISKFKFIKFREYKL